MSESSSQSTPVSYQGRLLLSAPEMEDPNFYRAAVLLIEHSTQGAMGLILNQPTHTSLTEIWDQVDDEQLENIACDRPDPVFLGGPCEGLLSAIHQSEEIGQIEIEQGLYFTTAATLLQDLIEQDAEPVRFFVGYAGWGPGQLEAELEHGGWLLAANDAQTTFSDPKELWANTLRQVNPTLARLTFNPQLRPIDPSLN